MSTTPRLKQAVWLLGYAVPYWPYWLALLLATGLAIALELLLPWPTKLLVDHVLGAQPLPPALAAAIGFLPIAHSKASLLLLVCVSTIVMVVLGTLVHTAADFLRVALGHRLAYGLGGDILLHLQRLSLLFHKEQRVGDLASRITDDAFCVQILVVRVLIPLVQSVVFILGAFFVLWRMEPVMAYLALGVLPLLGMLLFAFDGRLQRPCRDRRLLEGRMASIVHQALSSLPLVQAFNRETLEHDRYRTCAGEAVAAHQRAVLVDIWFKSLTCLITSGGMALIIWVGAQQVLAGTMTVGGILVVLVYVQALFGPIRVIVDSASTWQIMAVCADRVSEVIDVHPAVSNAPDAKELKLRGDIQFENVGFAYEPGRPVLQSIHLEARSGETVAIVGPTGSGKTTLVNLLLRLFDPTEGRVLIDGHDLRSLSIRCLREQIAIVLQQPFILAGTVAENIAYGKLDATPREIVEAAKAANAHDFIERLPDGYATVIGEQGSSLSGGERQRLAIARAFIRNAPILILDEPTSALDAHAESLLVEALERLCHGRTTFVIAHRLSTVRNADRICVLQLGHMVESGSHEQLRAAGGLYQHLYATQMGHESGAAPTRGLAVSVTAEAQT